MKILLMVMIMVILPLTVSAATLIAEGQINIKKVNSAEKLALLLEKIPMEEVGDREPSCNYQAKIGAMVLEGSLLRLQIDFEFYGGEKLCGDGMLGSKRLWKRISKIKHLKLYPIEAYPII